MQGSEERFSFLLFSFILNDNDKLPPEVYNYFIDLDEKYSRIIKSIGRIIRK